MNDEQTINYQHKTMNYQQKTMKAALDALLKGDTSKRDSLMEDMELARLKLRAAMEARNVL